MPTRYISIQQPTLHDREKIEKLFRETIADTYNREGGCFSKRHQEKISIPSKMESFLYAMQKRKSDYWLVARSGNDIVGTISTGKASKMFWEAFPNFQESSTVIKNVYIHPTFQQQGIGKQLFNSMLCLLQKSSVEEFFLDSGFSDAQRYWEKRLGSPTVILYDYWNPKRDHFFWKKRVQDFPVHNKSCTCSSF